MPLGFLTTKFFNIDHTKRLKSSYILLWLLILPSLILSSSSCSLLPSEQTPDKSSAGSPSRQKTPSVDVAVARFGSTGKNPEYIGTTFPVREVSLRSRLEGQLLDLTVDVGDRVNAGQVLVRIDDAINKATVLEAEAELAALRSEVTSLQAEVNQATNQVRQAKITLKQAQSDLARSNQLVKEGAITQQSAEQAQNTLDNAQQALESAQQQVQNRSSAVNAAQQRVAAQLALVTQERQRESFSTMISPVTGSVLARILEPGDLAQVGDEVLQLGDFSQIKVRSQISERELGKIRVGHRAQVKLDAFPAQTFTGEVTQVSLAADPTARLIPIEVTIPNPDRRVGSGLLARVNFGQQSKQTIVIPAAAVGIASNKVKEISADPVDTATIFVIQSEGANTTVIAREVELGNRANSQVEIISGLEPGEKFVVRSSGNLKAGDRVNLSFLSESSAETLDKQ